MDAKRIFKTFYKVAKIFFLFFTWFYVCIEIYFVTFCDHSYSRERWLRSLLCFNRLSLIISSTPASFLINVLYTSHLTYFFKFVTLIADLRLLQSSVPAKKTSSLYKRVLHYFINSQNAMIFLYYFIIYFCCFPKFVSVILHKTRVDFDRFLPTLTWWIRALVCYDWILILT